MIFYNGEYYAELEDLLDDLKEREEDVPKYVYGTEKYRVEVNIESAIDEAEEDSELEDFYFDVKGRQILTDFVEKWNEEYGTDAYYVDNNTIILIKDIEE